MCVDQDKSGLVAHIVVDEGCGVRFESLEAHLRLTALLASEFAEPLGLTATANLLGRVHDFGKASNAFQQYIRSALESEEKGSDSDCKRHGPDHSTAAAKWLDVQAGFPAGIGGLIGYAVAGHHSGLPDGTSDSPASESWRVRFKVVNEWESAARSQLPPELFEVAVPKVCTEISQLNRPGVMSLAMRIRMLFSALVDADYLATERFMDEHRGLVRLMRQPSMSDLESRLEDYLKSFESSKAPSPVDEIRRNVRTACLKAAGLRPGLFTLEVPTGGGKTLSSMAFAVRHARLHGLRRIVYVIPFTSIIEQNAEVFRKVFGEDVVLEHHSNRDPERVSDRMKLLTENWDAPIVVTTNVQFFESLYANRPSRCRKLHNLAGSVIVMDEAQSLPASFLRPCLHALDDLMVNYGATVVICTATLPAFFRGDFIPASDRNGAWSGLSGREDGRRNIVDGRSLESKLKRVKGERLSGKVTDDDLVERLSNERTVLVIVSTRAHARRLFTKLGNVGDGESAFHLSAQMCPAHRLDVIEKVKACLEKDLPCRLVSTQLIEAGVDIDFPCVYREIAGCDSIVQAAGRCNREGRLASGRLVVFESDEKNAIPAGDLATAADKGREILSLPECRADFLSSAAIHRYFKLRYADIDAAGGLDVKNIFDKFVCENADPFGFGFKSCAEAFRLIPDEGVTVYVPYGEKGRALCEQLRSTYAVGEIRKIARRLCRYAVTVHGCEPRNREGNLYAEHVHDMFWVLTSPELNYSEEFGLSVEPLEGLLAV